MVAFIRPENDIFRLGRASLVQAIVNPTSTSGLDQGGLMDAVRSQFPQAYADYYAETLNNRLHVGGLFVTPIVGRPFSIITLPTRSSPYDAPNELLIEAALGALRTYMSETGHDIAVPLIGCGRNYDFAKTVKPIMMDVLGPTKQIAHVCVRPAYFKVPFKAMRLKIDVVDGVKMAAGFPDDYAAATLIIATKEARECLPKDDRIVVIAKRGLAQDINEARYVQDIIADILENQP